MAITTTEYANFEKKAFFDNREWLNQENWQMYFGGSLPTGVLVKGKLESSGVDYTSALSRQVLNANYIGFHAGSILADGIFATYEGGNSIPVINSGDVDRLFVARVAVTAGTIKIIGMTKVAAEYGYTPVLFAKMLLQDESLAMTRNTETYDIPLCYEIFGGDVFDLRRLIYLPGQSPDVEINYNRTDVTNSATIPGILYGRDFVQIYGGMNYNVNFVSGDTSTSFYVYPNPSCSEKQAVVKLANDSSTAKQIRIPLKWKGLEFAYSWLESWDADPNNRYLYKELVAGDRMTMIFTPNGHETAFNYAVTNKSSASGGGIDSEDYFTKQEIAAQMVLKANVSDMNDALAQKEDKTALGSLAYQSQADYVSQVINKPTLGALASKDQVNIATEVNGILPIANGGTGASDFAGIVSNMFIDITFYVDDDNGSDTTGDGSSSNPFKSIQFAIDKVGYLQKGTIKIKSGSYVLSTAINIPRYKRIVFETISNSEYVTISRNSGYELTVEGELEIACGNYLISNGIYCTNGGKLIIRDHKGAGSNLIFTVINTKTLYAYNNGEILSFYNVSASSSSLNPSRANITLTNNSGICINCQNGSRAFFLKTPNIVSNSSYKIAASDCSIIQLSDSSSDIRSSEISILAGSFVVRDYSISAY